MSTVDTVVAYFAEILRRQPTDAESSTWVARIEDAADRNQALDELCAHLLAQAEDVRSIIRLYQTVFERIPDFGGLSFWVGVFRKIQDDNPGLSHTAVLDKTIVNWSSSQEYIAKYGNNLSDVDFVEALYRNALGRASDEGGLNFWVSHLRSGAIDREQLVVLFSESAELKARADADANAVLKLAAQLASPETGDDPSTSVPGNNPFQGVLGNDAPVAADDAASGDEDTAIVGNVLVNEGDLEADPLTVIEVNGAARTDDAVVLPSGARLTIAADGSFVYTPAAGFSGSDSFTYTVSDGRGGEAQATVTLAVGADNDVPVAIDDAASGDEDTAITGNVLANDSDPDGDSLSVTEVNGMARTDDPVMLPSGARLTIAAGGSFVYTPAVGFNGSDSFTYTVSDGRGGEAQATVTLAVGADNDAPVAVDDAASGDEDTAITGNVLANDSDPDGDSLSVTEVNGAARTDNPVTLPSGARLTIAADGSFVYTPAANFNGSDTFTYTVSDGRGGTAMATATLAVGAVNDAPVAVDDAASGDEDTAITGNVLANDSDPDGDSLSVTEVNGAARTDDPVTLPSGARLTIAADDSFDYTPAADFNGSDSFTYTVSDGRGGEAQATATLTVEAVNDAPVAVDDAASGNENTAISGNVLGNDSDPDGDSLSVTEVNGAARTDDPVTLPSGARLTIAADGSYTYEPVADFNGSDSFTYTVSDGQGGETQATVEIAVTGITDRFGFVIPGIDAGDFSGISVSSAGDVNGDGIDDLIIGATGADPNDILNAGECYVVFGTRGGFGASLDLSSLNGSNGFVINGIDSFDQPGFSVSGAGDVNGDGVDDLIIGAQDADPNGNESAGESYVVFGTRGGFDASLDLSSLNGSNGRVIE